MTPQSADPISSPLSTPHIPGLDGLRAVSVLLVLAAHFGFERWAPGGLGVTAFFFISGLLITTLMVREARQTGRVAIVPFYLRRALRLYPELLLLVAVGAAAGGLLIPVRFVDVAAALGYATNYLAMIDEARNTQATAWPHLWSLAVEEHFYLTFPLLFAALRRRPRRLTGVLCAVCAAALAWRCWVVRHGAPFGLPEAGAVQSYTTVASECRLDSIVYGCLAALLFAWRPQVLARSRFSAAAGVTGLGLLLLSLAVRQEAFRDSVRYTLQGLGLMAAFIGLYATAGGRSVLQALEHPWLRRAGVLSYGVYLWHMELRFAFLTNTRHALDTLPLVERVPVALALSAGSFLLADLSWRLVRPVGRLRRSLGSHSAAQAPVEARQAA